MKGKGVRGVPLSDFPLNPNHKLAMAMKKIDWGLLKSPESLFQKGYRPFQPIRRILGLLILEEVRGLKGEELLQQWLETPVLQYFTGEDLFHWDLPITNEEIQMSKTQLTSKGFEILRSMVDEVNKK